jgi:hypothetical protein
MSIKPLQGPIETIRQVIAKAGPATDRQIEQHPEVVAACRSSKTKARRHIDRLVQLGHVQTDGALQQRKVWVEAYTGKSSHEM